MKNCNKCGNTLYDEAVICPACGCPQGGYVRPKPKDSANILWFIVSFFVFWFGIVAFLVWKDVAPKRAKMCLSGSLTYLGLSVIVFIFVIFLAIWTGQGGF